MILVVDDDPDIARFVEVNLRSAGFDVAVATDGEEALRRAEEIRPDLVLLDVMMPRVDGFEVAQRLRRNTRTATVSMTARGALNYVVRTIFEDPDPPPVAHAAIRAGCGAVTISSAPGPGLTSPVA